MSLSRIEVITGMSKFSSLKAALSKAGVRGMTVMQVLGCGVEKGTREYEVDELEEMELLPKQHMGIRRTANSNPRSRGGPLTPPTST